jgi:hypothetical protein
MMIATDLGPPPLGPSPEEAEPNIQLGRWQDGQLVLEPCRLRRLSQAGAVVHSARAIAVGTSVWIKLQDAGRRPRSIPARVARVDEAAEVWLTFAHPCTPDLLYAALFGPNVDDAGLN